MAEAAAAVRVNILQETDPLDPAGVGADPQHVLGGGGPGDQGRPAGGQEPQEEPQEDVYLEIYLKNKILMV